MIFTLEEAVKILFDGGTHLQVYYAIKIIYEAQNG